MGSLCTGDTLTNYIVYKIYEVAEFKPEVPSQGMEISSLKCDPYVFFDNNLSSQ